MTDRYASSTNRTEGDKPRIGAFVAVELNFSSGYVRAHDGLGDIAWSGNTYSGVGKFGTVEIKEESIEQVADTFTLLLSGVDSGLIATALTEVYQGRSVTVYLGFWNMEANALTDTPEVWKQGVMSQMQVNLGTENSIKLICTTDLRNGPAEANYTDADLKLRYSGDRFFDLLGKIPGFHGTWGTKGAANDGSVPPSPPPGWRTPYKP